LFAAIRINPMAAFFFPLIESSLARALHFFPSPEGIRASRRNVTRAQAETHRIEMPAIST